MDLTITIFIQAAAFLAVALLVMKFGWPHIIGAIEERQKKIAEGLAAANKGQKDLDEAKVQARRTSSRKRATRLCRSSIRRASARTKSSRTPSPLPTRKASVCWVRRATASRWKARVRVRVCATKWVRWR